MICSILNLPDRLYSLKKVVACNICIIAALSFLAEERATEQIIFTDSRSPFYSGKHLYHKIRWVAGEKIV